MKTRAFLLTALAAACTTTAPVTEDGKPPVAEDGKPPAQQAAPPSTAPILDRSAVRPQYDLAGETLTYAVGETGAHTIAIQTVATGVIQRFEMVGDNIDPTWTPEGQIVFASNRDGDFDLWLLDPATGAQEQATNLDGDEVQPTVAPVPFGFYAVQNGMCGGGPTGRMLDAYHKVLFTRRVGGSSEIWFSSLKPTVPPQVTRRKQKYQPSAHGAHSGRVSPPGRHCASPSFSGDGLSALSVCDGVIGDAHAKYEQSFAAALATVKGDAPNECQGWRVDFDKCLPKLERRYASYPASSASAPGSALSNPAYSANQTVIVADANGAPMARARFQKDAEWTPLPGTPSAQNVVWSPTGAEIAFAGADGVARHPTDFYLQSVRNLHQFPELFDQNASALLQTNRFVVRPADHKEFYVLHDKLRYDERPQFITADVALQAFRDEFLRLLEKGEATAAESLRQLSRAMMDHYVARIASGTPTDRYYAVLFATAWVPLEAAATMKRPDFDERMEFQWSKDALEPDERARIEALMKPVASRLGASVSPVIKRVPATIRSAVEAHIDRMLRHSGIEKIAVPGQKKPLKVDFSQFKIRGAYAENDLGGYFLAMNWFANLPMPIDASLKTFVDALRAVKAEGRSGLQSWKRIDGLVGSFMGRPVDATVKQVTEELRRNPNISTKALKARLLKRRGEVPIRDASGGDRKIAVTLFPKRVGLDVTFFRALTHPKVKRRGMPSSLDVFATAGNERARKHSLDAAGNLAGDYRRALERLGKNSRAGLASTDLYHSWLAALVVLAEPLGLPQDSTLAFAKNEAWHDRQLSSALAGYTQLKHAAVLYAMQDLGVECDGETSFHVAVEQPIRPRPLGFVEPNVAFYDALAALAGQTYQRLYDDPAGPNAQQWAGENDPRLNAMNFAKDLAAIARVELDGKPLTDEQANWIEYVGGELEPLTVGMVPGSASFSTGGDGRQQRGVALVTDIHTNTQRKQVLQIGIGRIFDLWVVVPSAVGQRVTQGGVLSFYEFTNPMSDRLTDAQWGARIDSGQLPALPPWTQSFLESKK